MRKVSVLLLIAVIAGMSPRPAPGQEGVGILYSMHRQFRIPFHSIPNEGSVKQLQLHYSIDQGRTWQASSASAPDQKFFRFQTDRDGFYWFTVQTTDLQGRTTPLSLENAQPSLIVVIDTTPPQVQLQASPPRNGEIGVAWSIRDDNLDLALPDAVKLEYRPNGGAWLPVSFNLNANQHSWNPIGAGPWEVRMKARDRAGNVGEGTATVNAVGGPGGGIVPDPARKDPPPFGNDRPITNLPNAPTENQVRYVNKMLVALDYQIKEEGPSGVSKVELWYTEDGRSWNKGGEYDHNKEESKLPFRAAREALYGISLIAKSGVGLGDAPPQVGDRPHLWIEIDTTKPEVQLSQVVVGRGAEKGSLTLQWKAFDKNLTRTPMTISYAKEAAGPWIPFAEKIANHGKHTWKMPAEVPYQFFVRVEAIDKAGNIGEAVTPDAVKVDLSNPKVNIINVQPATTPP